MESWPVVRLQMLAWGYSRVLTIEINCVHHGIWRAELPEEQEWYCCPMCNQAAKVCHIIEGYTRRAIVSEWQLVGKALSAKARYWLMTGIDDYVEKRSRRHKRLRDEAEHKALRAYKRGQNLGVINTRSAAR